MTKWFQRSLMALGALFFTFIASWFLFQATENPLIENVQIILMLFAFGLSLVSIITGIGAFSQWIGKQSGEKAKRGLVYEDAMLNRIMSRLDDEERSYLQGYLASQSPESNEDFFYVTEENQDYGNK